MDTLDDRESDFNLVKDTEMVKFMPNHQLMSRPRLREKDHKPQRIFFYQRFTDRKIMCWTEQEASLMVISSHRFMYQQLGCSDGTAYRLAIQNCGIKPGTLISREKAQKILDDAMAAEIEAAKGHYDDPQSQNVHFDNSFPLDQRPTFVPPK